MPSQTGERRHTNRGQSKNAGTRSGKEWEVSIFQVEKRKKWPGMKQHKGEKEPNESGFMNLVLCSSIFLPNVQEISANFYPLDKPIYKTVFMW